MERVLEATINAARFKFKKIKVDCVVFNNGTKVGTMKATKVKYDPETGAMEGIFPDPIEGTSFRIRVTGSI